MPAGPSIVPLLIRYLHRLMHNARSDSPLGAIWLIIPAALFSGGTILYQAHDIIETLCLDRDTLEKGILLQRGKKSYKRLRVE